MHPALKFAFANLVLLSFAVPAQATPKIPAGSKVCIEKADGGFDIALRGAFDKKKVPLTVVDDCAAADYRIRVSEEKKGSAVRGVFIGLWNEVEAHVEIVDLKTSEVVYGYNWDKANRGMQSAAEGCAKHIKDDAIAH